MVHLLLGGKKKLTIKNKQLCQVKKNMFAMGTLFFEVGAEILTNASGFLAANPDNIMRTSG